MFHFDCECMVDSFIGLIREGLVRNCGCGEQPEIRKHDPLLIANACLEVIVCGGPGQPRINARFS